MKTFILGVGAQKAATSWLYNNIQNDPRCAVGIAKEYHVFDNIVYEPTIHLKSNYDLYFDHFVKLFESKDIAMDITPSYAGLDIKNFELIYKKFTSLNIDVRVIFIMREPVTRAESYLRMINSADSASLESHIGSAYDNYRSNYRQTVNNLDKIFPNVFYGFYETLFNDTTINKLENFIDIKFDKNKKIFSTPKKQIYSLSFLKKQKLKYKDNYSFVQERFDFDIKHWNHALKGLSE